MRCLFKTACIENWWYSLIIHWVYEKKSNKIFSIMQRNSIILKLLFYNRIKRVVYDRLIIDVISPGFRGGRGLSNNAAP